jgi:very-short-patch-repair endonuclease
MHPAAVARELGGSATKAQLLVVCTEREVARAVANDSLVRLSRGRYAVPHAREAVHAAARLSGTVTHLSAAQYYGWEVAVVPDRPWIAVPRNRNVAAADRKLTHVVYSTATGLVTGPVRTVLDCARRLPFGEGLAVADSALRHRHVEQGALVRAAEVARGPGAGQCRRVAREATALAANPLESMLRAIALEVPGLLVHPQVEIRLPGFTVHPDLVDERLGLVIEAEGFMFHAATPRQFDRDVERYTQLVVTGRTVARFTRSQIEERPDYVLDMLNMLVAMLEERALVQTCSTCSGPPPQAESGAGCGPTARLSQRRTD